MGWRWKGVRNGKSWRSAKSLVILGHQLEAKDPERDVTPDGTVASQGHSRRNPTSDHEIGKDPKGVVCAIDIAHNTDKNGTNIAEVFEAIRLSKDKRIKYAIYNNQIFSSYSRRGSDPYEWRPYKGSNPHKSHGHISVKADPALYDDETPWIIERQELPPPPEEAKSNDSLSVGDEGNAVRRFRIALHRWKRDSIVEGDVTGHYNENMARMVKSFQKDLDIEATGKIDAITSALLSLYLLPWNSPTDKRLSALEKKINS